MFIHVHRQLRRRRGLVLVAVGMLAAAAMAMAVHSALMAGGDEHPATAAAMCLAIGGCAAFVAVAAVIVGAVRQRPRWLIPAPPAPALPFVPRLPGFLVRAGPPVALAVFRL